MGPLFFDIDLVIPIIEVFKPDLYYKQKYLHSFSNTSANLWYLYHGK